MALSRRRFLKLGTHAAFGGMLVYTLRGVIPGGNGGTENADAEGDAAWARYRPDDHAWAFIVDTTKCIGCGLCARACKLENNVPWEANCNRTWVERYRFLKNGEVLVDSPEGGINGFYNPDGQERIVVEPTVDYNENGLPNYVPLPNDGGEVDPEEIEKSFFVPKLCNQCDASPCVQVCPVGATYKTRDGIVLVNQDRCIGCRYCVQACPYGTRYLVPKGKVTPTGQSGVADKCTWCYHRITKGLMPACVDACPVGARAFGDLNDHESTVSKILAEERIQVLKPELGTKPKTKYIGLDEAVR